MNIEKQVNVAIEIRNDLENFLDGNSYNHEYRCSAESCENCPLYVFGDQDKNQCGNSYNEPRTRLGMINEFLNEHDSYGEVYFGSETEYKIKKLNQEIERKENLILEYQVPLTNTVNKLREKM